MRHSSHPAWPIKPSLSFVLLITFLAILWLAGGTSRADALGQAVVRGAAWLLLLIAALFRRQAPKFEEKAVWLFLAAMALLALVQLVPLPPSLWDALPNRKPLLTAAQLAGSVQPWRPWTIVPSATINAASSLIVPFATLIFATGLSPREREILPSVILAGIVSAMLLGLLQFSGVSFDNPFIDDIRGQVGGIFANRNHFALLLCFGILILPAWIFSGRHLSRWRVPVGFCLLISLFLAILGTGSRAGMALGIISIAISAALAKRPIEDVLKNYPRWIFPALAVAIIGVIALFVWASIAADRAASISRLITADPEQDMRRRALPTVWTMIRIYFPMGTGFGDFATIFRIHEPFDLLKPTYFNRAHNDFLEIVLNAGLPGLILLLVALGWWLSRSARAWRAGSSLRNIQPKLGSAMLLLVFLASVVDYPSRTPTMMAIITLAALWLSWGARHQSPLPIKNERL